MRSPPVTLVPYLLDGGIELHPIAARYFLQPSGDDADLQRIALSIQKQGTIEPVITYESMLLDGQVRDKSNIEHGLPRWAIRFEDTPQGIIAAQARSKEAMDRAALEYAIAKNLV